MPTLYTVLLICCFQFSFSSIYCSQGRTSTAVYYYFYTQYRTSNVAENMGSYLSCTQRIALGKDFELILRVKMETRHPVERHFEVNFRLSVIIAEL